MSIYVIEFFAEHPEHCFKIHGAILLRGKVIYVV